MTATVERPGRDVGGAGDLRRLARGGSANLAGTVVSVAVHLVVPVVVARGLSKDDAGLFFQATALFAILLTTGAAGADTGLLRAVPEALTLRRHADVRRLVVLALVPVTAVSLCLVGGTLLAVDRLGVLIAGSGTADDLEAAVLVSLPLLPVATWYLLVLSLSRGLGSVRPLVFIDKLLRSALEAGGVAAMVLVSASLSLVVLAWVAPYLVVLLLTGAWVVRRLSRQPHRDEQPPTAWRPLAAEFWRFSAPRAVSRVFTVALQRLDIIIVGVIAGPAEAAVYTAATRLLVLGLVLVQSIQQVMAPRISELFALDDRSRVSTLYGTTTAWLTLVSWPVYLLAMLFAPPLLGVFGSGYRSGATAAVVLCAAMLVATACGPVDSVLLMGGRSGLSMLNTGLALGTNVALDLLLVPTFGITGAAIAWAVAILVNNLLPLWQVRRCFGLTPFGAATSAAFVASLLFGGAAGLTRLLLGGGALGLVVAGLSGTVVLALFCRRHAGALELGALRAVARRRSAGGR